jgi:hypothetical protein
VGSAAGITLLTVFLTWPQSLGLGTTIGAHRDTYFSAWRIAWVAHALETDPEHLFDANIYYPERRALAYSDAILLQSLIAAPFLWLGARPVVVYHLLLLGGIALSGIGMFVLARHLTQDGKASFVAAAIFTMIPYRVEHYIHLELQWTMWIPLAFWAVHRTLEDASWRVGALAGLIVALQLFSCIYYAIFLALFLPVLVLLLVATRPRRVIASVAAIVPGGVVAAMLAYPYSGPYVANAMRAGGRDLRDAVAFSTTLPAYVTAPRENWLWGWTAERFSGDELHLFPGLLAVALAMLGLAGGPRRIICVYIVIGLLAAELSRGVYGVLYPVLHEHLWPLQGIRAVARFSVVGFCALALLAGFGVEYLQQRAGSRYRRWICPIIVVLLMAEYGSAPIELEQVPTQTPAVYEALRELGPGVVMELPAQRGRRGGEMDARYQYWATTHWYPLVNGYSGHAPPSYRETLQLMTTFPDDRSITRLRELNVRHLVIHEDLFPAGEGRALTARVATRPEFIPGGRYADWIGQAQLFELRSRED